MWNYENGWNCWSSGFVYWESIFDPQITLHQTFLGMTLKHRSWNIPCASLNVILIYMCIYICLCTFLHVYIFISCYFWCQNYLLHFSSLKIMSSQSHVYGEKKLPNLLSHVRSMVSNLPELIPKCRTCSELSVPSGVVFPPKEEKLLWYIYLYIYMNDKYLYFHIYLNNIQLYWFWKCFIKHSKY